MWPQELSMMSGMMSGMTSPLEVTLRQNLEMVVRCREEELMRLQ